MGVLTKKEKDGLEDVFLSIHTSTNKYKKIKNLSAIFTGIKTALNFKKHLKHADYGLKETKFSQYLLKLTKKKKNLSK